MGPLSSLLIRLEKAATFHFHVHLGFNLGEFIQSLDGDVTQAAQEMSVLDFMSEPDVCDECGVALDLNDPDTLSVEYVPEDGTEAFDLYYHLRCSTPEMISEADSEDEDAED
jgi:hypothetical protein